MFELRTRRDKWRILLLGAASFLTIFPLCAWRHLEIIEKDILDRATSAIEEAGLVGVGLVVDGRDVIVELPAGQGDADALLERVRAVRGVRLVRVAGAS